tara:strand:- start:657 stop:1331 length:675 start_codon:yes stop_codon:yes gene_type:complete
MKKNILIIGYGDIAKRLDGLVNKDKYELYGVSRTNKDNRIKNHIKWDWLSTKTPELKNTIFDSIIFLPKPSSMDESGYNDGFIESSKNIFSFIKKTPFKKFITISSTRVYGKDKEDVCLESDVIEPKEFRAKIINRYELNQIERYQEKLFILRFSGLYDSISQKNSLNVLHRNNAAKIINFFIEYTSLDHINPIFNCSEDQNEEASNISNSKLKKTGFIFDAYN